MNGHTLKKIYKKPYFPNVVKIICVSVDGNPNSKDWRLIIFDPENIELGYILSSYGHVSQNSKNDDLSGLNIVEIDVSKQLPIGTSSFGKFIDMIHFWQEKNRIELITTFKNTRNMLENKQFMHRQIKDRTLDFANSLFYMEKEELNSIIAKYK